MTINTESKILLLRQLIHAIRHDLELYAELVSTIKHFLFADEEVLVWELKKDKLALWLIPSLPPEFATPNCIFQTPSYQEAFQEALPVMLALQRLELCSAIRAEFNL